MSGPSDEAVEAAWQCAATEDGTLNVSAILKAAHDPKLGVKASVCLEDVLKWLRREGVVTDEGGTGWDYLIPNGGDIAGWLERDHHERRL